MCRTNRIEVMIYLIGGCLIFVAALMINKRKKKEELLLNWMNERKNNKIESARETMSESIYWWDFEKFILFSQYGICTNEIDVKWMAIAMTMFFASHLHTHLPLCCCWPAFENGGSLYWSVSLPIGYAEYWFAVGSDSYVDANATSTPCWKRWYANQAQPPYNFIVVTVSENFKKEMKYVNRWLNWKQKIKHTSGINEITHVPINKKRKNMVALTFPVP